VFNGYESACTASVVIDTFSVMLTGQTNSRSVSSRTGQLANESSRQQCFKNHGNTTTCTTSNNKKNILKRVTSEVLAAVGSVL